MYNYGLVFPPIDRREWSSPGRPILLRADHPVLPPRHERQSSWSRASIGCGRTRARLTYPGGIVFFRPPCPVAARGIASARFRSGLVQSSIGRGFLSPPNRFAGRPNPGGHVARESLLLLRNAARWNGTPVTAAGSGNKKWKNLPSRTRPEAPKSSSSSSPLRGFVRGTRRKLQPVALINKRNSKQYRSQTNKAQNPVTPTQLGNVVEKYFADREGDQKQGLPARKRRALPKADRHQGRAVDQPDCGIAEIAGQR